jgi:hypothetical protein
MCVMVRPRVRVRVRVRVWVRVGFRVRVRVRVRVWVRVTPCVSRRSSSAFTTMVTDASCAPLGVRGEGEGEG